MNQVFGPAPLPEAAAEVPFQRGPDPVIEVDPGVIVASQEVVQQGEPIQVCEKRGNGVEVGLSTGEAVIGGTTAGAGNLIAGNAAAGILIDAGASGTLVQGNIIGTDVSGAVALGNQDGIDCLGVDNTIGGTTVGAGDLVSGNNSGGILLEGDARRLAGYGLVLPLLRSGALRAG